MSKRCHDCIHLQKVWRCEVPLPMHLEAVRVGHEPNHDTHAEGCECFENRHDRTSDQPSPPAASPTKDRWHYYDSNVCVKVAPIKQLCGTCGHFSGRHCREHEVACMAGDGGQCKEWKADILSRFMAGPHPADTTTRDYLVAVLESVRDIEGDVAAEFLVKAMAVLDARVAELEKSR